jgi:dTDP-4-dehydrorhamnose reductase
MKLKINHFDKKIFITGGNGVLGKKLVNYLSPNYKVLSPSSKDCDILNLNNLTNTINHFQPDVVIHLASFVDTFGCEENIEKAININVIGTLNIVKACLNISCKFVYISSEYVFSGNKGNYTVEDRLDPINVYGKTKSSAEYITSILPNYQIIRAPFIRKTYPKAFSDQYCSRYFLDEAVEKITYNIFNNSQNLVHISSERISLYDLYVKNGIQAESITIPTNQSKIIPKDTSLINNSI